MIELLSENSFRARQPGMSDVAPPKDPGKWWSKKNIFHPIRYAEQKAVWEKYKDTLAQEAEYQRLNGTHH